uniref:Uncharacterized protein LOC111123765 isoform X2 n=1 Tax=Crassostrea virginica TaxID=6565 RepID=A0A8B8E346_CRAVI|nr:uncharacterized protein LOC111123765 isoform X2 [Crassostrea virginica]
MDILVTDVYRSATAIILKTVTLRVGVSPGKIPEANCTTTCPDGYFGDKCLDICNCAKSQVCEADIGCVNSTYELEIDTTNFKVETILIIIVVSGSCGLILLIGITVYCIRKKRSIGRDKNNTKYSTARSPSDSESPIVEDPFVNTFKNCTPNNARLNGSSYLEIIGGHQNPDSHPTRFSTFSTNAHQFNNDLPSECEYHEPWNTLPGRITEQPRIVKTKTYSSRDRGK